MEKNTQIYSFLNRVKNKADRFDDYKCEIICDGATYMLKCTEEITSHNRGGSFRYSLIKEGEGIFCYVPGQEIADYLSQFKNISSLDGQVILQSETMNKEIVVNEYSYQELYQAVQSNQSQENVFALAEWFEQYGASYWNGECYQVDKTVELKPIYDFTKTNDNDGYDVIGWEYDGKDYLSPDLDNDIDITDDM